MLYAWRGEAKETYYRAKETYYRAKETYYRAKETYYRAKETYYRAKVTYYRAKETYYMYTAASDPREAHATVSVRERESERASVSGSDVVCLV